MAPWWHFRGAASRTYLPVESGDDGSEPSSPFLEKANMQLRRPKGTKSWAVTGIMLGTFLGIFGTVLFMQLAGIATIFNQEIYHSPVPKFSHLIRRFSHDSIFAQPPSPESDVAWQTLEGPTYFANPSPFNQVGYIRVDGSRRWEGIEPGYPLPDGTQKYGASLSHQLHCLGALRRISFGLLHGSINITEFLKNDQDVYAPDFVPTNTGVWHLTHCFDYLRQALQCAGDMSVEWPTYFGEKPIVVGWNVPHKCVDYNSAMIYLENNG